ncbi:polysaccharide deacetylase family protein [Streptomyces sp. NPDC058469]|uniref:polysaccharide deacetylase family protein n=1 Tax=Streptomyces sp. NPDC058469 TaxID=3346514 RepID=UPI003665F60C
MRDYDDFARARGTVAEITGTRPTLFRPPYGIMSTAAHAAARRLEPTPVLWTCWARAGPRGPHPSQSTAR